MIQVGVSGAAGRMGRAVADGIEKADGLVLAALLGQKSLVLYAAESKPGEHETGQDDAAQKEVDEKRASGTHGYDRRRGRPQGPPSKPAAAGTRPSPDWAALPRRGV